MSMSFKEFLINESITVDGDNVADDVNKVKQRSRMDKGRRAQMGVNDANEQKKQATKDAQSDRTKLSALRKRKADLQAGSAMLDKQIAAEEKRAGGA